MSVLLKCVPGGTANCPANSPPYESKTLNITPDLRVHESKSKHWNTVLFLSSTFLKLDIRCTDRLTLFQKHEILPQNTKSCSLTERTTIHARQYGRIILHTVLKWLFSVVISVHIFWIVLSTCDPQQIEVHIRAAYLPYTLTYCISAVL